MYIYFDNFECSEKVTCLNPKVHSPPFAATVVAAVLYLLYQEDPVFQPLSLTVMLTKYSLLSVTYF